MEVVLIILGLIFYILPIKVAFTVFTSYKDELLRNNNANGRDILHLIWFLLFIYLPIVNIILIFVMIKRREILKAQRENNERMIIRRENILTSRFHPEKDDENVGITFKF